MSQPRSKKTLAVLGLDGMSWQYMYKLIDNGVMPYTKHLLQKSFKADLEALPPVTPPSWTSIMTGVNPGKHGIFGFFYYDKKTWNQRLYTALDLKHPRIHEMLSFLGYKSIVFNPIPDYPIIPVSNATIISNLFFTPKPISYPKEAYQKYFGNLDPHKYTSKTTCEIIDYYTQVVNIYEEAINKAIRENYTLLWVTLGAPDILFHRCPEILGTTRILPSEKKLFNRIDTLIKILDENHDSIIIVSDHGFSYYDNVISINDILVRHGLAHITNKPSFRELHEYRLEHGLAKLDAPSFTRISIPFKIYKLSRKLRLYYIYRFIAKFYYKVTGKKIIVSPSSWIDKEASVAMMPDSYSFGIFIKDKTVVKKVIKVLDKYTDILDYYINTDIFNGKYVHQAPDIIVFPKFSKGYNITSKVLGLITVKRNAYGHHPLGTLLIRSDDIILTQYNMLRKLKLPNYSVATLALYILNIPLAKSRDKVPILEKMLDQESLLEYNYLAKWSILRKSLDLRL